jgi:hypothetical protein
MAESIRAEREVGPSRWVVVTWATGLLWLAATVVALGLGTPVAVAVVEGLTATGAAEVAQALAGLVSDVLVPVLLGIGLGVIALWLVCGLSEVVDGLVRRGRDWRWRVAAGLLAPSRLP